MCAHVIGSPQSLIQRLVAFYDVHLVPLNRALGSCLCTCVQAHESQAKRCQNHFHQPQFAPLAHFPPVFTLAALTPCWSSVNIGSIPALDGKFLKQESCAFQRITAGPFNASTDKMVLTGKDFGLGWTAGVSTLPDQQPVSGLLFLSKQGSTGQCSRHASSHDACMRGVMAQVYDVP